MDKLGIAIIFIIGVLFRLAMLDKPEGLWNDEYVSYMISQKPLLDGFFEGLLAQCHMPFYYLYLKLTMFLFGTSDIILRAASAFAGILSVIVMYFVGLEKNKNTGLLTFALTAISSFLIYYSQEVRIYSLLFLFSAMTLLFSLRLIKNPTKNNLIMCLISNFLILFTHTIGFVFVFFNLIFISLKLYKSHKNIIIKLWSAIGILSILILPQAAAILVKKTFSQWWGHFSPSVFGFLMTDYFSPIITNFTGAPQNFFYNLTPEFIIFAIVPAFIALFFLIKSLKEKENRELILVAISTILVLTLAAILQKLVFVTKYSIEIYPILIYLVSSGVQYCKNKILKHSAIIVFLALNLIFLTTNSNAAYKLPRKEGHNLAAQLIKDSNLKPNDIIIIQYYNKERFEKYFDFSNYQLISMNKGNFHEYIKPDTSYEDLYSNGKNILKNTFLSEYNPYLNSKLANEIRLENGQSVLLLVLKSVSFFDDSTIYKISSNDEYYSSTPLFFLVFSHLKNQTFMNLAKQYPIVGFKEKGEWAVVKFTKLKN